MQLHQAAQQRCCGPQLGGVVIAAQRRRGREVAPLPRATPPDVAVSASAAVQQQREQEQQQQPAPLLLSTAPVRKARPWLPLNEPAVWQGTEAQALNDAQSCFKGLSPTWKVMLLSDGSVTRHLQLMTGSPVHVDCLEMVNIGEDTQGLPSAASLISGGARVQRTVLLRGPPSPPSTRAATPAMARAHSPSSDAPPCKLNAQTDGSTATALGPEGHSSGGNGHAAAAGDGGVSSSSGAGQTSFSSPSTSAPSTAASAAGGSPSSNRTAQASPSTAAAFPGPSAQASSSAAAAAAPQASEAPAASAGASPDPSQGTPLVYAVSWWRAEEVDRYLADRSKPIWVSLSQGHVELYREVQLVHHGHSAELEALLGCPGPFWGRQYLFWHQGRPLTLIYEVFSPLLEQYLGPVLPCLPDE